MHDTLCARLIPEGNLASLLDSWTLHSPRTRHALLRGIADAVTGCLAAGGDLLEVDVQGSYSDGSALRLLPHQAGPALLPQALQEILLEANALFTGDWSNRERLYVLVRFQRGMAAVRPGLTREWCRGVIAAANQVAIHSLGAWYRQQLRHAPPPAPNCLTGVWRPDPGCDLEALLDSLCTQEQGGVRFLSRSRRAEVFEASLSGRQVVVKRFFPGRSAWRYRWQPSRARRAWAGARTLERAGISCPTALGFVEEYENGIPVLGYLLTEKLPGVMAGRQWVKPRLHRRPAEERRAWRHGLREQFLQLYERGLRHEDCKIHNLLLSASHPRPDQWWWIDFEDIRAGRRPFFWEVYRNFVQLNGSIGRGIPEEERRAFARGFRKYPLFKRALVIRMIERRTRVRLHRELTRRRTS